jgi:hypothetical protein
MSRRLIGRRERLLQFHVGHVRLHLPARSVTLPSAALGGATSWGPQFIIEVFNNIPWLRKIDCLYGIDPPGE